MSEGIPSLVADAVGDSTPQPGASAADQCAALSGGCALLPGRLRGLIVATGDDRNDFLHGMLTNDVRSLEPGGGMPAAFLTDAGKVVGVMRVYCEEDALLLDSPSWGVAGLVAGLDRFLIADDVEMETEDVPSPLVCLEGPRSREVASAVLGSDFDGVPAYGHRRVVFDGTELFVAMASELGGEGVGIWGDAASGERLVAACMDAGAVIAGLQALQAVRVRAGVPWLGVDMGEDTLLMEIGLDETVSRTKGCYLGQEVVERVSARGQVNRRWTRFGLASEPGAASPMRIESDAGEVGRLSSTAVHPDGSVWGVGLLHRKAVGAPLHIQGARGTIALEVVGDAVG